MKYGESNENRMGFLEMMKIMIMSSDDDYDNEF